jgi:hypothetical protein
MEPRIGTSRSAGISARTGERSLDVRGEFINFFNTPPQFDKPGVQLALATFGKITNTVNKGRQVQFTLKLNF